MSFGRWLLTHSLSLFLVVMLLAAWFWREELELDRAWSQLRQVGSEMELARSEPQPTLREEQATSVPAVAEATAEPTPTSKDREVSAQSDAAPAAEREAAVTPAPANETAARPQTDQQRLMAARKAFWARDFDRAISLYQELIEANPRSPDYLGELGNIYYNLNRFDRAAELFHRAGLLLVELGDRARARQLLPALMSLDRELGKQLQQALEQGGKPAAGDQS